MPDADYYNNNGKYKIQEFRAKSQSPENIWGWSLLSNALIDYYDGLKKEIDHFHLWLNAAYALHLVGFANAAEQCLNKGLSYNSKHEHSLEVLERIRVKNYPFNEGLVRPVIPPRHYAQISEYSNKIISLLVSGIPVSELKVFIVHGTREDLKQTCARFIEKLGLKAIILHELPSKGNSILEKLGYFIGKLSRKRVWVLYEEGVELPSDYHGIIYINIDPNGAWRFELAKELIACGISINVNKSLI